MGLLDTLMQQRAVGLSQINDPRMPLYQALTAMADGAFAGTGVTVNETTAMRVIAVNACVKLIAETIAALPLQTYNRGDESRVAIRKPSESYVWDQPNPEMTPMEFWEQVFGSLLLNGNAFIETVRFKRGARAIAELWPIDPRAVNVERTKDGRKAYVIPNSGTYDASQILHIPAFRRAGDDRGMSPIASAREGIGVSVAAERLAAKFFSNGAFLSGLLEVDADLSGKPDVAAALAANFSHIHGGPDKAFKVGVIDNNAKFREMTIPPEDLQFMEARKFQVVEICRLYQVPPHMVADVERSTSWGTGIEQQGIQFVVYSLMRWVRRSEMAISKFLLPSQERYAKWNLSALLRGDSASRGTFYGGGRQGGWLSINDIRRLEDLPPIPNGDDYLQPLNFAPVGSPAALGEGAAPERNGNRQHDLKELLHV
jgi:HK97 family phage portal protein